MSKVIDLRLDFPLTVEEIVETLMFYVLNKEGRGVANYRQIFGPRMAANIGVEFDELEKMSQSLTPEKFEAFLLEGAGKIAVSLPEFEKELDDAGAYGGAHVTERESTQLGEVLEGLHRHRLKRHEANYGSFTGS